MIDNFYFILLLHEIGILINDSLSLISLFWIAWDWHFDSFCIDFLFFNCMISNLNFLFYFYMYGFLREWFLHAEGEYQMNHGLPYSIRKDSMPYCFCGKEITHFWRKVVAHTVGTMIWDWFCEMEGYIRILGVAFSYMHNEIMFHVLSEQWTFLKIEPDMGFFLRELACIFNGMISTHHHEIRQIVLH